MRAPRPEVRRFAIEGFFDELDDCGFHVLERQEHYAELFGDVLGHAVCGQAR